MSHISTAVRSLTIAAFAVLLLAAAAAAQDVKTYLVLPFEYSGPAKYQYFSKAFQADLNNRLEWAGHFLPAQGIDPSGLKHPTNESNAIQMAESLGVDYIVWGGISIIEKDSTISMKVQGKNGDKWSNKGQMPMNDISPWLKESASAVMGDVYQRPGYGQTGEQKLEAKQKSSSSGPKGSNFLSGDGSDQANNYGAKTLNPQFRYEGGVDTPGRWRSQTFRFPSINMVVGDGDGDGKNEIFILEKHKLHAFRYEEGKLAPLKTYELSKTYLAFRLSLIDVDRDGTDELVLSGFKDDLPLSYIFSFKGGGFSIVADRVRLFLGVLNLPPTFRPVLVCQKKGYRDFFDKYMYEAIYSNGEVKAGSRINTAPFSNIFNTCYVPDGDSYKIAVLNEFRRLLTFASTLERQAETQESYNTSSVVVSYEDIPLGMSTSPTKGLDSYLYIPIRMTAANLSQKNKFELLVNKDITVAGAIFDRFHKFAQGEIHALVWDGVGMNLAWKTRRIKGTVVDYCVVDLNNDGKKQLAVLVNTYPGDLGFKFRKTLVVTYELDM
ncbi:FG-GAP repeat domain-containing protein [Salidesulfovibrio onnuriiensis]|uniref:FG-GAP repeat domain-containing protein n=1 Tax=Salidesulfovibrio onnuriiensis TaxID=2583823 RepID=UPI00164F15C6|nr:VCBS repeat-containing protein [Salidesulfovibrio onnuriiensis]